MQQIFILNQDSIEKKLLTLTKTGISSDGWTEFYLDNIGNENWILIRYQSGFHGGGVPALKRLPELSTDELILLLINSPHGDDIVGASLELSEREELRSEDFRKKLLMRLSLFDMRNLSPFERLRIETIIDKTDLRNPLNRRDIVGKTLNQIQTDAEYFKSIANSAAEILAQLRK